MNINLYICILAGISLMFYLMYPHDSTYGAIALTDIMSGELSVLQIIQSVASYISTAWAPLSVVALIIGILATAFGSNAVIPIVWNLAVFFVIPNFFILPTHLLTLDTLGLPLELRVIIIFLLNVMLLLTAMEFWR